MIKSENQIEQPHQQHLYEIYFKVFVFLPAIPQVKGEILQEVSFELLLNVLKLPFVFDNKMPNNETESETGCVENLNHIKLPPFWSSKPELWFKQIESQFFIHKINSDKSKYHLTVANLPIDIFSEVIDVINNPPNSNMYESLKGIIINRLTLSEEARLDKLISRSELGDKRPSNFFRELLQISGDKIIDEKLLIKLWRRRLPAVIDIALTASGKDDVTELLKLSDKIWESQNSKMNINEIQGPSTQTDNTFLVKFMTDFNNSCQTLLKTILDKQIKLENEVSSIKQENLSSHRRNDNQCHSCRHRSKSRNRYNNDSDKLLCSYHKRFKLKAFKCNGPPCLLYDSFKNKSKNE